MIKEFEKLKQVFDKLESELDLLGYILIDVTVSRRGEEDAE